MSRLDISDFSSAHSPAGDPAAHVVRPSSIVYWSRFGLAIFAALICFVLRLKGEVGIIVAFLIYVISCFLFKYGFKYGEVELKGKQRVVSLGSGTFVFVWAAIWILLYTLSPY